MNLPFSSAALLLATVSPLSAQAWPGHALVATETPGPITNLVDVDLDTGAINHFGSFPSKFNKPLAVEIDPIDQHIILAIADGTNSRILRLFPRGQRIIGERLLGIVPGRVSSLVIRPHSDSIFASALGPLEGLYRLPRNGGAAALVVPIPRSTALGDKGWVAQSAIPGQPGSDPQFQLIELETGRIVIQPATLTNFGVEGLTGIVEIPSALGFVIITNSGGNLTRASGFTPPVSLNVTPQLPPGSTIAIELREERIPIVLGGAAHPFLKTTEVFSTSPPTWQVLAGPLPGTPVDFDIAAPAQARLLQFGEPCASATMPRLFGFTPTLGNQDFELDLHSAAPGRPAFLILGLNEQHFLGGPLPIVLPAGACPLRISADRVLRIDSDATGAASMKIPIPNNPALNGTSFFAQWAILNGGDLEMTNAIAVQMFAAR